MQAYKKLSIEENPVSPDLTDWDQGIFEKLISHDITDEARERILNPAETYPRQGSVLAVHWHPEFVPMDMIRQRIEATFPGAENSLIIPTQHNTLTTYDAFTGVEIDCYSTGFDRKVQLLLHFENSRVESPRADVFKVMLDHTFRYRSHQLFEFWDTILEPAFEARIHRAAVQTGADDDLVHFVRIHTDKLKRLFEMHELRTPPDAIRNKLLTNYFEALHDRYPEQLVDHACRLVRAIKKIVKSHFSPEFFYATEEVIEEVRSLGGGIIIPHPEQFWPILLADYDVDGYEVWNPQSQEYTQFLVDVVNRQNRKREGRRLLITMGDDCHMGEKVKPVRYQQPAKAGREIGVQPAWDDLSIRKTLTFARANRAMVVEEYKQRLLSGTD